MSRKLGRKMAGGRRGGMEKSRPLFQLFIVRRTDNLNSPISLSLHILNAAICARKFAVLRHNWTQREQPTRKCKNLPVPPKLRTCSTLARLKYKFHISRFRLFWSEIMRVSRNTFVRFRNHGLLKHGSCERAFQSPENYELYTSRNL